MSRQCEGCDNEINEEACASIMVRVRAEDAEPGQPRERTRWFCCVICAAQAMITFVAVCNAAAMQKIEYEQEHKN